MPAAPPDDATCLTCGYALRGNVSHVCPECGRVFDLDDLMSFDCRMSRRARREKAIDAMARVAHLRVSPLITAAIFTLLSTLAGFGNVIDFQFEPASWWLGFACWLTAVAQCRPKLSRLRGVPGWSIRTVVLGCLGGTLINNVRLDACEHATYVSFGPYTWVTSGRGCGNTRQWKTLLQLTRTPRSFRD
jgi:predicted RNA-binding Zn-ribbon protein involved in translation (DUF1610 family)